MFDRTIPPRGTDTPVRPHRRTHVRTHVLALLVLAAGTGALWTAPSAAQALAGGDAAVRGAFHVETLHVGPVATLRSGTFRLVAAAGMPGLLDAGFAEGFRRGALALLAGPEPAQTVREVAGGAEAEVPSVFALGGNYPNPFNPQTTLRLDLPEAAHVTVALYDVLGRQVLVVPAVELGAGSGRTVTVDASGLPSGVYVYRVTALMGRGREVRTGHMTLLR
jgi:hypothetical protein